MANQKQGEGSGVAAPLREEKTRGREILDGLEQSSELELRSDRKIHQGPRPSEIRRFLLRFAARRGIRIKEHLSETPPGPCWFVRLEDATNMATAVSYEGPDNALVMAFLSFENPAYNFLD